MLHLTRRTSFLLLFTFLISLVHHHHPALLRRPTVILDRSLTFLVVFCTLVLKPSFSQSLSLHSHLSLAQAHVMEFDKLMFGSHSVGRAEQCSCAGTRRNAVPVNNFGTETVFK